MKPVTAVHIPFNPTSDQTCVSTTTQPPLIQLLPVILLGANCTSTLTDETAVSVESERCTCRRVTTEGVSRVGLSPTSSHQHGPLTVTPELSSSLILHPPGRPVQRSAPAFSRRRSANAFSRSQAGPTDPLLGTPRDRQRFHRLNIKFLPYLPEGSRQTLIELNKMNKRAGLFIS